MTALLWIALALALLLAVALYSILRGPYVEPEWHPQGQADLDHKRKTGKWPA